MPFPSVAAGVTTTTSSIPILCA